MTDPMPTHDSDPNPGRAIPARGLPFVDSYLGEIRLRLRRLRAVGGLARLLALSVGSAVVVVLLDGVVPFSSEVRRWIRWIPLCVALAVPIREWLRHRRNPYDRTRYGSTRYGSTRYGGRRYRADRSSTDGRPRRRTDGELRRAALVAEETHPRLEHLLSTYLDLDTSTGISDAPGSSIPVSDVPVSRSAVRGLFEDRLVRRLGERSPRAIASGSGVARKTRRWSWTTGTVLLLFAASGVVTSQGAREFLRHWWALDGLEGSRRGGVIADRISTALGADPEEVLDRMRITVHPPAYAEAEAFEAPFVGTIKALPGSRIVVGGPRVPSDWTLTFQVLGGARAAGSEVIPESADRWLEWVTAPSDRGFVVTFEQEGVEAARRIVPIESIPDRIPTVTWLSPEADQVFASAVGTVELLATASDDFGLEDFAVEWVLSRGSGESFSFSDGRWDWTSTSRASGVHTGEFGLDLSELDLAPGDLLHVRAVATDRNDITGPGQGVSETRVLRIARDDEIDEVTTLIGFPIEREREPILSQRMIILLTETLIADSVGMEAEAFRTESEKIAAEQARLRLQIGEEIFVRSTGAMETPDDHLGTVPDPTNSNADPAADPAAAVTDPTIDPEHEHDSDPIIAINDSLLTAHNVMFESEVFLMQAEPSPSLPSQYRALAILQALRDADRIFARGRTTVAPVDLDRARGMGELEDGGPAPRSPNPSDSRADPWLEEIEALLHDEDSPAEDVGLRMLELATRLVADPAVELGVGARVSEAADRISNGFPAQARRLLGEAATLLTGGREPAGTARLAIPESAAEARYLDRIRAGGG